MSKGTSMLSKNGGWGISTEGKDPKLCTNFYVAATEKVYIYRVPESKPTTYITLQARFSDGESEAFTVALSVLDKINWADVDDRCILYPNIAPATAQRYIATHIREKLADVAAEERYRLGRVGYHSVEGEPVYCAGGEIIRSPQADRSIVIEPEEIRDILDFDPTLSEEETAAEMFGLISLFPDVGRILLSYNLLFLMRELYVFAWKAPLFCLYVYGKSDSRKTTLCTFLCQLYDRRKGIVRPPRFDSSIPQLVRILYSKSDSVVVFDDLCPSESKEIQRKQEKALLQIVRIIGDGIKPGRVDMKASDLEMPPPKVGAVLTAEYLVSGTASDMARFLAIEVSPPDNETQGKLAVFQKDKPLVVSTFYRNFIQWTIDNYDWAKEFLAEWWRTYGQSDFTAFGTKVHGRLRETHYYLNTAYIMFLTYCTGKGVISEDDAKALHESFLKLLTELALAQQARVEEGKINTNSGVKIDYLAFIRELYKGGEFRLAPSAKEFNIETHDGVVHLGRLYLYGESFRRIIRATNVNLTDALDDLDSRGALVLGSKDRTVQLFVSPKEKRRCYAIHLTHLK